MEPARRDERDERPGARLAPGVAGLREAAEEERERRAERIAERLDAPMAALGILFLLLVIAEALAEEPALEPFFQVASWLVWAAFVGEFVLRAAVAPSLGRFFKRNWWQVLFLALPFLRFLRLLRVVRFARAGRVLSSAVRSSRSAGRLLSGRVAWLAAVQAIVILASSQLLYEFANAESYARALYLAALGSVAGEPTLLEGTVANVLDVFLAAWSVVVFATLAAMLAAYFFERGGEKRRRDAEQEAGARGA